MRQLDTLKATGFLEVIKLYPDGTQEVHWADSNTITSGMGLGFGILFGRPTEIEPTVSILDYQIRYFQLGVSGSNSYDYSISELVSSVPELYLSGTGLPISVHEQYANGQVLTDQTFVTISQSNIYKASPTTARYHIIIPANSGNNIGIPVNEVGLFMQNPFGSGGTYSAAGVHRSILVAYKYFSPILKTSDFALLFRWSINF